MRFSSRTIRLCLVALSVVFVAVAFSIRLVRDRNLQSTGPLEQDSGTALYAAVVYVAVLFVRPRMQPLRAGGIALAVCWLVEFFQLTPVPGALSAQSAVVRLIVGAHFDWRDVAWYPVGIVPLVILDQLLAVRTRLAAPGAGTGPA